MALLSAINEGESSSPDLDTIPEGVYEVSTGWTVDEDDSAFYPGYGFIPDPDPYYSSTNIVERYISGEGPSYFHERNSYGTYGDSWYRTTLVLTDVDTSYDYAPYDVEGIIEPDSIITVSAPLVGGTQIRLELPSSDREYFCFVEGELSPFWNPSLSVYTSDGTVIVEDADLRNDRYEGVMLPPISGKCFLDIEGRPSLTPNAPVSIWLIEGSTSTSSGVYFTDVDDTNLTSMTEFDDPNPIENHDSTIVTLDGTTDNMEMIRGSFGFSGGFDVGILRYYVPIGDFYFCAIPLTDTIDIMMDMLTYDFIDVPASYTFESSDVIHCVDQNGAGGPEIYTGSYDENEEFGYCWQVFDSEVGSSAGNIIVFWGER